MPKKEDVVSYKISIVWKLISQQLKKYKMRYIYDIESYNFYSYKLIWYFKDLEKQIIEQANKKNLQKELKSYKLYFYYKVETFVNNLEKEYKNLK